MRVTVWDGSVPGLGWTTGSQSGNIPLGVNVIKPDVTIIEACGLVRILVVYALTTGPTATYRFKIFQVLNCPNLNVPIAPIAFGIIDPTATSDVGIHVDADETGNFAIAYSMAFLNYQKIQTVIGGSNCNGQVFCPTIYTLNPNTPSEAETDPDVCIQSVANGASSIHYSYLNKTHDILYIRGEKHPGSATGFCFDTPLPNSIAYKYIAQPGNQLYSPRIAAPRRYFSVQKGDDFTVVFYEKEVITSPRYYVRGYTSTSPIPATIPLCPLPNCNGVETYNNANGVTSPANYAPAPTSLDKYPSEYPVVTYSDENMCQEIIVGWNVKYPAPNSGGVASWDPVIIRLNLTGHSLASTRYFQVPSSSQSLNQTALSVAGRCSVNGSSSIQYSLYDASGSRVKGKAIACPFQSLREEVSVEEVEEASNSLSVFPNPAADKLTIQLPPNKEALQITIYDIVGSVVKDFNVPLGDQTIEFSLENLPAGSYYIKCLSCRAEVYGTARFLKQ